MLGMGLKFGDRAAYVCWLTKYEQLITMQNSYFSLKAFITSIFSFFLNHIN